MRDVGEVTGDDARYDRPRRRPRESVLERHLLAGKKQEACLGAGRGIEVHHGEKTKTLYQVHT